MKNLKKQEKFNISYSTGNGAPIKPGSYKDIRELGEALKTATNKRLSNSDYSININTGHNEVLLKGSLAAYSEKTKYKTNNFKGYQVLHSTGELTAISWEKLTVKIDELLAKNPTHPIIIWGSNEGSRKYGELIIDNGKNATISKNEN